MSPKLATLGGIFGTVLSWSLAQWNDAVGLVAGVLTVAHLIRAHWKLNAEKKK